MKKILTKAKQKLKQNRGFSLVELLMTTLIMLMAASIVARGIPAAQKVYKRTVDVANAQVLLSTALIVLRDDVGFATEVKVADDATALSGNKITFLSPRKGVITLSAKMGSETSTSEDDEEDESETAATTEKTMAQALMISDGLSDNQGYKLQFSTVRLIKDDQALSNKTIKTVAFDKLQVVKKGYTEPLAELTEFQIRLINPVTLSTSGGE